MSKLDKSDPFVGLPRRPLFRPVDVIVPKSVVDSLGDGDHAVGVKRLDAVVANHNEGEARLRAEISAAPRRVGRPVVIGKPWEAEGLSRSAWYRRQQVAKP